jgi:hypothetical protein
MKMAQSTLDTGRSVRVSVAEVPPTAIIQDLCLSNRAYQVLYTLGDTSHTVRTVEPGEARCLVGIVADIRDGRRVTELDRFLASKMSNAMMLYVAEGGL